MNWAHAFPCDVYEGPAAVHIFFRTCKSMGPYELHVRQLVVVKAAVRLQQVPCPGSGVHSLVPLPDVFPDRYGHSA